MRQKDRRIDDSRGRSWKTREEIRNTKAMESKPELFSVEALAIRITQKVFYFHSVAEQIP